MGFHEECIDAGCGCSPRERFDELTLSAAAGPEAAGKLDAVGGIKDDRVAKPAHDRERAHVADEIVISESCAALCEQNFLIADGGDFVADVFHVPGGEKLAFFYINGFAGFCGGQDEISLAAEECRDLKDVHGLCCGFHLVFGVDVGGDGDAEFFAYLCEDGQAFVDTGAAIACYGTAVGFVVAGFKDV